MWFLLPVASGILLDTAEKAYVAAARCSLCEGIVVEMYTEVSKFKWTDDENPVIDTTDAICLAMVQKYISKSGLTLSEDGFCLTV